MLSTNNTSTVGIGLGTDYKSVTRTAIENTGVWELLIKEGYTVLIKPNLVMCARPEQGVVTDYRVIQEIVEMARVSGASKVIIAEASPLGNTLSLCSRIAGVDELLDMNCCTKEECYLLKAENSLTGKEFYIPKQYYDADFIISAAKLKTHFEDDAVVSLSLKNSLGVPPTKLCGETYKETLHFAGLKEAIVDINMIRTPDFVVIDGIVGGEGYGPLKPEPVQAGIVIAGRDPVAVDTAALTFMGFTVQEVPHVKLAAEKGLGICEFDRIKIVGAELDSIKINFKRAQ